MGTAAATAAAEQGSSSSRSSSSGAAAAQEQQRRQTSTTTKCALHTVDIYKYILHMYYRKHATNNFVHELRRSKLEPRMRCTADTKHHPPPRRLIRHCYYHTTTFCFIQQREVSHCSNCMTPSRNPPDQRPCCSHVSVSDT